MFFLYIAIAKGSVLKGFIDFKDGKNIIILSVCIVAWVVSLTNVAESSALDDLLDISEKGLAALTTIFGFKSVVASGSGVPLVSGLFTSVESSLATIEQYLSVSNALVLAQIILLSIGKSMFFKVLAFIAIVGTLFTQYRTLSLKIFVVLIMVSPGLGIYVYTIQGIANEVKVDYHSPLTTKLDSIDAQVKKHQTAHQTSLDSLQARQIASNQEKGKSDTLTWLQRVEDRLIGTAYTASTTVTSGLRKIAAVLSEGGKELIVAALNLLVSSILQFLVLPGLYAYVMVLIMKRFFGIQVQVRPMVLRSSKVKDSTNTSSKASQIGSSSKTVKKS